MKMKVARKANLELLRIISILLIISHHYYVHGGWAEITFENEIFLKIVGGWARIAIACFVLLTGYFGEKIKPGRVARLVINRWVYSFLITAFLMIINQYSLSISLIFRTLFPLISCRHNYITTFCILYLFIPFLNSFVDSGNMSRSAMKLFIILSSVLFSLIPSIVPQFSKNIYSYLLWMMYLYIVGRGLQKYRFDLPWKSLLLILSGINLFFLFFIERYTSYSYFKYVNLQYSIPSLFIPICLIMVFSGLKIKYQGLITTLSKSTFAVYIIHDDPYIRGIIWKKVFHNHLFGTNKYLWIHWLCTVIIVYVVCVLLEKILNHTLFSMLYKKIPIDRIETKINSFYEGVHII